MNSIVAWLDGLFGKLPLLPVEARNLLRKLLPWLIVIGSALTLLAIAVGLGILSSAFVLVPWAFYGTGTLGMIDLYLLTPLACILGLIGGSGMIKGKAKGWELAVYSELLFAIGGILNLQFGTILTHLIGLWFLFQIRPYFGADESSAPVQ